jgi:hypothetical protein
MGRQFQCLLPTAGVELPAAELEVIRRKVTSVAYSSIEDSSAVARRSDNEVMQPHETKASQEKKLVQLGNKLAHSEQKLVELQMKWKELQIEHFNCSQQHAREKRWKTTFICQRKRIICKKPSIIFNWNSKQYKWPLIMLKELPAGQVQMKERHLRSSATCEGAREWIVIHFRVPYHC